MKLQQAIEIVQKERSEHHSFSTDLIGQAEQLLIEAGKRLEHYRQVNLTYRERLLPGETKD